MSARIPMAVVACLLACMTSKVSAADGGFMTRCHGESGGARWAITDGDFSFEACKARVIDCTGNANAVVHYENMGPVLVPYPAKSCTVKFPGAAASAPKKP